MSEATPEVGADAVEQIGALLDAEETPEETQAQESTDAVQEQEAEASEPEVEAQADTEENETPEEEVETLELDAEQLASVLNVDPDSVSVTDTGELKFKTKIDGQVGEATLSELVKSFQLEGHVNQKSMQLAEQQRQFREQSQQAQTQMQEQLGQTAALLNSAEQQLLAEFQSIDWNTLRMQDPGEFAAQRQMFEERNGQIQNAKAQAMQFAQQQQYQQQQAWNAQLKEHLPQEIELLQAKIPAWTDIEVMETGKKELATYLKNNGIPDEQVSNLYDHKWVVLAHKAMLWDKAQTQTDVAKKRVKKTAKAVKGGSVKSKQQKADESYQSDMKKFRKNSNVDSAAAMISQHFLGE